MKHLLVIVAAAVLFSATAMADNKPVTFEKLPTAARQFVNTNFPNAEVLRVMQDDDLICPDYFVALAGGVKIDFSHNGALEKVESERAGVPDSIVPVQIRDYVSSHYPGSVILEYEVGRKGYEVKLSNRMELKFNQGFHLMKIDG